MFFSTYRVHRTVSSHEKIGPIGFNIHEFGHIKMEIFPNASEWSKCQLKNPGGFETTNKNMEQKNISFLPWPESTLNRHLLIGNPYEGHPCGVGEIQPFKKMTNEQKSIFVLFLMVFR